jgi:hypothetical protein
MVAVLLAVFLLTTSQFENRRAAAAASRFISQSGAN